MHTALCNICYRTFNCLTTTIFFLKIYSCKFHYYFKYTAIFGAWSSDFANFGSTHRINCIVLYVYADMRSTSSARARSSYLDMIIDLASLYIMKLFFFSQKTIYQLVSRRHNCYNIGHFMHVSIIAFKFLMLRE